jgi:parallel beta-helix repeat protein
MVDSKLVKYKILNITIVAVLVSHLIFISLLGVDHAISEPENNGTEILVDPEGTGDSPTIQSAIDSAKNGDVIKLKPGEYYENITINKSISLIGSGTDNTFIIGSQTRTVVNLNANWSNISKLTISGYNSYSLLFIRGSYNSISDVVSYGGVIGIDLRDANYNTLSNCTCAYNSGAGLYMGGSAYNRILNLTSINCTYGNGIYLFYALKNVFQNGTLEGNAGDGFYAYWLSDFNVINNYDIKNNQGSGVHLFESDYFTFYNTSSTENNKNGFIVASIGNSIINCSSESNGADGFYLYHSDGSEFINCTSNLNTGRGFYLKYSSENQIFDNTIVGNEDLGIKIGLSSKSNTIYRNDLIFNNLGIIQANDVNKENQWYSDTAQTGNYWWDFKYLYPNTIIENDVWNVSYNLSTTGVNQDIYPLAKPSISNQGANNIIPGVMNDSDLDGVFDLIDQLPNNELECVDTDSDGIGNNEDMDDDNDDITDFDELKLGTNPLLNDTDGDTYNDNHDDYPLDSSKWKDNEKENDSSNFDPYWNWIIFLIILSLILVSIKLFSKIRSSSRSRK